MSSQDSYRKVKKQIPDILRRLEQQLKQQVHEEEEAGQKANRRVLDVCRVVLAAELDGYCPGIDPQKALETASKKHKNIVESINRKQAKLIQLRDWLNTRPQ